MQFSTRSTHVLYVLLLALCFTDGVRWKASRCQRSTEVSLSKAYIPAEGWRCPCWGPTFSLLLALWIKKHFILSTNATIDDRWKDLEKCWLSSFYLRCSMTEMSPLSGSKPFMYKPPFLARGVVRPCSPASLSFLFRSSVKLTDPALLGRASSGLGLNPISEDSLRLIEAARWNLS